MRGLSRFSTTAAALVAAVFALSAMLAVLAAGCGDDEDGPTGPAGAPNDTFDLAITPVAGFHRLMDTYAAQDAYWYDKMLTRDFRYVFSADADPDLVTEFGNTWGVANEVTSAIHLFQGFQGESEYQQEAVTIVVTIPDATLGVDPDHPDSTTHFTRVNSNFITILVTLADERGFSIATPVGVDLVRGDVAVLDDGQPADSTVYYVRRIVDRSPPLSRSFPPDRTDRATLPATWGQVRAQYLQ